MTRMNEVEQVKHAYRSAGSVWDRIAVLNDARWSFSARVSAAIELADEEPPAEIRGWLHTEAAV